MRHTYRVSSLMLVVALAACYHATITTGRPESQTVVEKDWAASFIYGLVPPDVVDVASKCPNNVAKVETQHSFLNGLVALITFGIFTPMEIKVTCAGGSGHASIQTAPTASFAERRQALQDAVASAMATQTPVLVHF